MDFESLGEAIINDSVEENDNYAKVGTEENGPIGRNDFEKAKLFLSKVNERQNISVYDHLADIINTILRSKVSNPIEKIEDISFKMKKMRQKPESDLTEVFEISEELQAFVKAKQIFYKFKTPALEADEVLKVIEDEEEEEEEEEEKEVVVDVGSSEFLTEETDLTDVLPDIPYIMSRFNEAGIGLSKIEAFELSVALKDLAIQFKLKKVRFWGKIQGIKNDYFIAEAPYQEGIVYENYGWEIPGKIKKKTEEGAEEKGDEKENEDEDKVEEESEEEEEKVETEEGGESDKPEEEKEEIKIPPIPEPQQKIKKKIPAEKKGTGVNEYLYFVNTKLGQPWRILPFMRPSHVSEARFVKRFFTGDLDSQIRGGFTYPGKEAHYLRAQIARITATTYIAPNDFYTTAGELDENGDEEDEEKADEIVLNPNFEPKTAKVLFLEGVKGWCHYRKAVLYQGRCMPMAVGEKEENEDENEKEPEEDEEASEDDEKKEEEEPEILEAIVEKEVPKLRCLSEDKALGGLIPWSMRLSSKLVEEKAILIVHSNIWPGAYTFYDGKQFEHIYIGYGYKYSVFHYAPPVQFIGQIEYEINDDVIEQVDEEVFPEEEVVKDAEGEEKGKEEGELDEGGGDEYKEKDEEEDEN